MRVHGGLGSFRVLASYRIKDPLMMPNRALARSRILEGGAPLLSEPFCKRFENYTKDRILGNFSNHIVKRDICFTKLHQVG